MKMSTLSFSKRAVVLAVAASVSLTTNAGFLDEFYTSAGAAANVTAAQAYQTQTMGIITGGGMVWRAPQKGFQPLYFTPPSVKAGCGGIDVFLGAFGLANKEQFVSFLRNVGQNATGLAFKVALHAMSPELETKIQEVAKDINDWTKHFRDSCQAANAIMNAGPSQWIDETIKKAKGEMVANGTSSDITAAGAEVDTNLGKAIANAPVLKNSAGQVIEAAELNILWSAFNSGNMGLTKAEKEMMMSLVGTTVMSKQGDGENATLQPQPFVKLFDIEDLIGSPNAATTQIPVYSCGSDTDKCMSPTRSERTEKPFARMVYEKAQGLQDAIMTRSQPNQDDIRLLTVTTSIPIYKIIQVVSLPSKSYLSGDMIEQYSMAIAQEIASRYIEDLSKNIEKMMTVAQAGGQSAIRVAALEAIRVRLVTVRLEMKDKRDELYQQINKNGAMISQIEHIERSMYGNLSASLAANLRFGK